MSRPRPNETHDQESIDRLHRAIALLEATDPESWWPGPTYRSPCGQYHCALAHIEAAWGMDEMERFEGEWANSYMIGGVNDGKNPDYPHPTPKERVLAYLNALADGDEPSIHESMWEDWCASETPHGKEQA